MTYFPWYVCWFPCQCQCCDYWPTNQAGTLNTKFDTRHVNFLILIFDFRSLHLIDIFCWVKVIDRGRKSFLGSFIEWDLTLAKWDLSIGIRIIRCLRLCQGEACILYGWSLRWIYSLVWRWRSFLYWLSFCG